MPFVEGTVLSVEQSEVTPNYWLLTQPLVYEGRDQTFRIEIGYPTDFASVPQFVQWLIPRTGAYSRATVLHDYFCDHLGWPHAPVNSVDTDGIFRRVLREDGVPFLKRWIMWTGVRWGALFNPRRRPGISRDLPLMLLLSLLFLPIVLLPSIGIAVGYLLYHLYDALTGGKKR